MEEDEEIETPSLLVIIIDMNTLFWSKREQECQQNKDLISFTTLMEHLLIFINAYLTQSRSNYISIISNNLFQSSFIFPTDEIEQNEVQNCEFHQIKAKLISETKRIMTTPFDFSKNNVTNFSGALSLALCYINRLQQQIQPQIITKPTDVSNRNNFAKSNLAASINTLNPPKPTSTTTTNQNNATNRPTSTLDSRILIIQGSQDIDTQYIPIMNCIFSAQKSGVLCDSLILSSIDSTFLQQASDLTNGIYFKLELKEQKSCLQYLITLFLHDKTTRNYLNLPVLTEVDFKASCFCHKKTTDIGYICSVCLSIFCKFIPVCSTCDTKFILPKITPPNLNRNNNNNSSNNIINNNNINNNNGNDNNNDNNNNGKDNNNEEYKSDKIIIKKEKMIIENDNDDKNNNNIGGYTNKNSRSFILN